jgi:hypothetical protein
MFVVLETPGDMFNACIPCVIWAYRVLLRTNARPMCSNEAFGAKWDFYPYIKSMEQ